MRISIVLAMVLLATALGGCGSLPEPTQPEKSQGEPPEETQEETECEWKQQRGIAELVEVEGDEGRFLFHPDGIAVSRSINDDWAAGDEFKAILETPEPADCADPRLIELRPLAPTD